MPAVPIRGVVFDKDGTLIDFNRTWPPVFRSIAEEIAARASDRELAGRLLWSGGQDPVTGQVAAGSAIAESSFEALAAHWLNLHPEVRVLDWPDSGDFGGWMRERSLDLLGKDQPVTDLAELFGQLRARGIAVGIATNDSTEGVRRMLDDRDLFLHVDFFSGSDAGHGAKPDPGMILAFCRETGRPPAETAMVGDSPADLAAGRAAGCGLVVGVLSGPSRKEDLAPMADVVIADITALPELLP